MFGYVTKPVANLKKSTQQENTLVQPLHLHLKTNH